MQQAKRLAAAGTWQVEKACGESLERWAAHVHYLKVVRRARMRRVAAKVRRGLKASVKATLRRGLSGFRRCVTVETLHRQTLELRYRVRASGERRQTGDALGLWAARATLGAARTAWVDHCAKDRHKRHLSEALSYWRAEVQWRIQRQKWMWRQVRYMQELQTVLDQAGDGQRLAKRLLSVGVEPSSAKSEQQLRVGRAAILRSTAALEKALRRETSPRRGSDASEEGEPRRTSIPEPSVHARPRTGLVTGLRVLEPGIDSYLEEYTPKPLPPAKRVGRRIDSQSGRYR